MEEKKVVCSKNPFKRIITFIIVALIVLCFVSSSMVITYPNEYAIVRQFGKIVRIEEEAGLSWRIPLITSESKMPKTIKVYDLSPSDVITSDKKTMTADCYVLWEITDAKKFIQTLNGSISTAESRIDTLVYNSIKKTISNMTQDEVIQSRDNDIIIATNDSELENLDNIVNIENNTNEDNKDIEIKNLSSDIMKNFEDVESQYGIVVRIVDLKVLDLPDENKNAVYERMIAERENISAQYTAMGESEAQIIKNTADKKASILLSEANATADKLVAEGEAEYMRILSEAYNDQEKADFYLYVRSLDALKNTMKQNGENTIILNEDSPIAQIFSNID